MHIAVIVTTSGLYCNVIGKITTSNDVTKLYNFYLIFNILDII